MVESRSDLQTKERIIAAGFELIARRGVRALTLDGVACQANLSKGGVLYHFGGKPDLIRAMLRDAFSRCLQSPSGEAWRSLVRALLAAEYMSPKELRDSVPLYVHLRNRGMRSNACASLAAEDMTSAIGEAFLAELGLGTLGGSRSLRGGRAVRQPPDPDQELGRR